MVVTSPPEPTLTPVPGGHEMSGDGRFVAFASSATNLVSGDTNLAPDVYLADRTLGTTTRVSVTWLGAEPGSGYVGDQMIDVSDDETLIAFRDNAPPQEYPTDIYRSVIMRGRDGASNLMSLTMINDYGIGLSPCLRSHDGHSSALTLGMHSSNMDGFTFKGQAFDLGWAIDFVGFGFSETDGSCSLTAPALPASASGLTFYLEMASVSGGEWLESNPVRLSILCPFACRPTSGRRTSSSERVSSSSWERDPLPWIRSRPRDLLRVDHAQAEGLEHGILHRHANGRGAASGQVNVNEQRGKVDEELSQATARVVIVFIALVVLLIVNDQPSPTSLLGLRIIGSYFLFGAVWWWIVRRWPGHAPLRQPVVILGDLGVLSMSLCLIETSGAAFYPLYLWVVVGNGMRFGPRYLLSAMFVSLIGFGAVLYSSSYWRAFLPLWIGLEVGLVVLPLFYLTLVRRLHHLNARLEEELERSKAAVSAKAQFLANMSHELRTPMNGILGLSFLMRDKELDDEGREYIELIHRSTDSLLHLINDILDFSKLDARMLRLEEISFNVVDVIRDTTDLLRVRVEEKRLELALELPDEEEGALIGDPHRLRQILFNLLGNAIKFTEHGVVRLSCLVEPGEGARRKVSIEVADSGIGISPENVERVFGKFEQADDSTSRRFGGSGLGLAISRGLARAMGGDIGVRSKLSEGSTFTLTLELERGQTQAYPLDSKTSELRDFALHALLAEDNLVNQVVARGMLERLGITIEIASDGEEALALAAENDYDLILMDAHMPRMSGYEAAAAIRRLDGPRGAVPILALTADATPESRAKARDAGMGGYVEKPFTLASITQALDALKEEPAGVSRLLSA